MSERRMLTEPRDTLCRLLLSRPYTEREALERLKKMGVEVREAEAIIEDLRGMGLLDDAVYARLFAEGHEDWGVERIRFALEQRGLSRELLSLALEECSMEEEAKACRLAQNWGKQGIEPLKIAARLSRRGFSHRTIRRVVRHDGDDEVTW